MTNIKSIDLNLLLIFDAMYRYQHVSEAAKHLRLSQPAVSYGLGKLREILDDALFVRAHGRMIPTEKANSIGPVIAETIQRLDVTLFSRNVFDLQEVHQLIRISVDDYIAQMILAPILKQVVKAAPNLQIEIINLRDRDPNAELQRDVDFAIRAIQGVSPNLMIQTIREEGFKLLADPKHYENAKAITLKSFVEQEHILVSPFGGFDGVVDEALRKKGLSRVVRFSLAHFSLAPALLKDSKYFLTLPESIATQFAKSHHLRLFDLPIDIPKFRINLLWHERTQRSPLHVWFRSLMKVSGR